MNRSSLALVEAGHPLYSLAMALSPEDKNLFEATYERNRLRRKHGFGSFGGLFVMPLVMMITQSKTLKDLYAHHEIAVLALLCMVFGLVLAFAIAASLFISRTQRRDDAIIDFAERNFPDDCSWIQEEKILAEAEALRLEARRHSSSPVGPSPAA